MATLVRLGNLIPIKKAGEELCRSKLHAPRKWPAVASVNVSVAGREKMLRIDMSCRQGILVKRHNLPDMAEVSVAGDVDGVSSDAPWRGASTAGRELVERDEEMSGGGRRGFMVCAFLLSALTTFKWTTAEAEAAAAEDKTLEVPLEPYSDIKDGFTLLRPAPWNKVDKPGASIFFEDPKSRSNNVGVTVAPVRIASLDGFGTVDDIVKKLIKAERDKPSTNDMKVISVLEKKLRDNTPLYSLEYTLDTTRGGKRVLTSVTVAGYKLYILSIVFTDGPVAPASTVLNDALHQVLNSFELLA